MVVALNPKEPNICTCILSGFRLVSMLIRSKSANGGHCTRHQGTEDPHGHSVLSEVRLVSFLSNSFVRGVPIVVIALDTKGPLGPGTRGISIVSSRHLETVVKLIRHKDYNCTTLSNKCKQEQAKPISVYTVLNTDGSTV